MKSRRYLGIVISFVLLFFYIFPAITVYFTGWQWWDRGEWYYGWAAVDQYMIFISCFLLGMGLFGLVFYKLMMWAEKGK